MFFSDHGGVQWLVVFLGNPGLKYQNTRHNAGFLTADVVEKDCGVHIDRLRFHALTAQAELSGQKVLLMKPQTFMNNSGEAVAPDVGCAHRHHAKVESGRVLLAFAQRN